MNPEDEPEFLKLPITCLEALLDNSFLYDLLKNESFDWETNDKIYMNNPS